MSSFNYKQQRDFEWWKSEANNKQRQPPNPPAPPGHRKWKTCGHQDCSLNTTMCCSCSDRRPVRAGYSSYVDGQGEVFTADRAEHYCPTCKLAPTRIPVPPPMPPPPPPAPSPARSLNLTELQLIASVTCMGIAEDLAIRVYQRLKPDVAPARLTADYLVNYILEDPEFFASTFTSIPSPPPASTPAFVPPPAPLFKPLAQPPPGRTNSLFSRMPNSLFDSPPSSPPSSPPLFPPPSPPSIFTPSTATNKPPVSSLFDDIDSPPPSPSSLSTLSLPPFFNPFITDPFSDLPPPPLKPAQFPPPSLPLAFSLPPPPPVAAITETTTVTTTRTTTAAESSCIVCFNSTINSVVIPCGHLAMCFPCAQNVKRVHKECPVCRRTMAEVYQTYHV